MHDNKIPDTIALYIFISICFAVLLLGCLGTNEISNPTNIISEASPTATGRFVPSKTPIPETTPSPSATVTRAFLNQTNQPVSKTPLPSTPIHGLLPVMPGWIAFYEDSGGIDLIKTDGSGWKQLIRGSGSFSWSPDGQWIVFVGLNDRDDTKNELFLLRADGSDQRRLTFAPHWKDSPSWSPDGRLIAYMDFGSDGLSGDIVTIQVDGTISHKLTYTPGIESNPAWSPDGKRIAFIYQENRLSPGFLFVMDSDGSNRRQVSAVPNTYGQLAWSPDGKQIAFDSEGCGEIYVINLDGTGLQQLTDLPGCASSPTWSPDGRHIAFNASQKECCNIMEMDWEIYIMNADGSGITQLTSNPDWVPFSPAWAPVPSLQVGSVYAIMEAGANLNLRDAPSLKGKVLKKLQAVEQVTILEGPVEADDYYWWKMRSREDGLEGWAVDHAGWYRLVKR
jgi:WD40 repeat protein